VEDVDTVSYRELALRPRSNPRVRTPMRNVSPFLGTVNRATVHEEETGGGVSGVSRVSATGSSPAASSGGGRVLGLGAGLSVGTILREQTPRNTNHPHPKLTKNALSHLSEKQGPSHRKLRRWNNDKFVGIASEISHANPNARGMHIATVFAEADLERDRYTMPNHPVKYSSYFTTLLGSGNGGDDGSSGGTTNESGRGGGNTTKRNGAGKLYTPSHITKTRERFLRGEISTSNPNAPSAGAKNRQQQRDDETYNNGRQMVKTKVPERLLNVVRRACQSSVWSREVLCAFEKELVHRLSMKGGDGGGDGGELKERESILINVLLQKPMVTRKNGSSGGTTTTTTMRFLFDNTSNNGAFNRLLLHGVSHFHGLDTSSTTTSRGERLVSVTGVCRGCQFRFLDFLDLVDDDDERRLDGGGGRDVDAGLCSSGGESSLQAQSMSTLEVS